MSVRWWSYLGGGQFFSVEAVLDTGSLNRPARLAKPPARTLSAVGDGAANLAAQIGGGAANVHGLHRDRVQHHHDSDRPEAA